MRITAKEAYERALIKINSESILDTIYKNISDTSEKGYMIYCINSDNMFNYGFTEPMIDTLFKNNNVRIKVIDQLREFGFDVVFTKSRITIIWNKNETNRTKS